MTNEAKLAITDRTTRGMAKAAFRATCHCGFLQFNRYFIVVDHAVPAVAPDRPMKQWDYFNLFLNSA